ncbi:hypothetical protein T484DRAFT_1645288, partial [Baffinella frigidus]
PPKLQILPKPLYPKPYRNPETLTPTEALKPQTPHPIPDPTPSLWKNTAGANVCTPLPSTLHPPPDTPNPRPQPLKPGTQNPYRTFETRNPKPETRNPRPTSPTPPPRAHTEQGCCVRDH